MLIEELKNIKSDIRELRKFGLTLGVFLTVIAIILLFVTGAFFTILIGIGVAFVLLGVFLPKVLLPFQKIWMGLALVLGAISSKIILTILFYVIMTPLGFFMRLFGKDFLHIKHEGAKKSYWINRGNKVYSQRDSEKQF